MGHVLTKSSSGAIVNEGAPSKIYSSYSSYPLRTAAGQRRQLYIFFNNPVPLSANGVKGILRIFNASAWAGSNTMTVRMVTTKWTVSKLKWTGKPSTGAIVSTITKTGGQALGTAWEHEIDAEMQAVSNAVPWWGFLVEITSSTDRKVGGPKSSDTLRPQLEVEWTEAPEAPDELYPSAGRLVAGARPYLKGNFVDQMGDTTMAGYKVQASVTDDDFVGTKFLDTEVISQDPTHYLTADIPPATPIFWRMMVKDGAGIWSDWSRTEDFQRTDHSSLVINNPAAGVTPFVEDPTPVIGWTFGGTQKNWCVIWKNLTTGREESSGKKTGTDNSFAIGPLDPGVTYALEVRVWDEKNREANVQQAYASAYREFVYLPSSGTTPVANLAVARNAFGPGADISFTRADFPDKFSLQRDGKTILTDIDPADVFVSGTTFRIKDLGASARKTHIWKVIPTVGTGSPSVSPSISTKFRSNSGWLCQEGGANAVPLFNMNTSGLVKKQTGATKQVMGSADNVILSVQRGGWEGQVTARLGSYSGVDADTLADRFENIRLSQDPRVYFAWSNQNIIAAIDQMNWLPVSKTEEVVYDVTFTLYQRSRM